MSARTSSLRKRQFSDCTTSDSGATQCGQRASTVGADGRQRAAAYSSARLRALGPGVPPARDRERGDARADRRHRRDRAPHGLGPRLRALAGLPAAPFRTEELSLVHRVREPRLRVPHHPRHAGHLARRTPRSSPARVRHLLRDAAAGAARRADRALPPQPAPRALALPALARRAHVRCHPHARGPRAHRARPATLGAPARDPRRRGSVCSRRQRDARDGGRAASREHRGAPSLVVPAGGLLARARNRGVRAVVRAAPRVAHSQSQPIRARRIRAAWRARAADDHRRGAVPNAPAVVARDRPRHDGGDGLGRAVAFVFGLWRPRRIA